MIHMIVCYCCELCVINRMNNDTIIKHSMATIGARLFSKRPRANCLWMVLECLGTHKEISCSVHVLLLQKMLFMNNRTRTHKIHSPIQNAFVIYSKVWNSILILNNNQYQTCSFEDNDHPFFGRLRPRLSLFCSGAFLPKNGGRYFQNVMSI